MKNIMKRSLLMLACAALLLTSAALIFARPIAAVFVGYDAGLLDMTTRAFFICALPFLVMWLNIYASSVFTALNDGAVSAAISFVRALLFPVVCIIVMPMIWKLDGIWFSLVASEWLGAFVSIGFLLIKRKKYNY